MVIIIKYINKAEKRKSSYLIFQRERSFGGRSKKLINEGSLGASLVK